MTQEKTQAKQTPDSPASTPGRARSLIHNSRKYRLIPFQSTSVLAQEIAITQVPDTPASLSPKIQAGSSFSPQAKAPVEHRRLGRQIPLVYWCNPWLNCTNPPPVSIVLQTTNHPSIPSRLFPRPRRLIREVPEHRGFDSGWGGKEA